MGDIYWNDVQLLLHFDGADPAWQADASQYGNDIITVTNSFGVALGFGAFSDSAGRGGTGLASRAEIANSAGFVFDADFTVEGWCYRGQTVGVQGMLNFGGTTGSNRSWAIYWNGSALGLELSTSGAAAAATLTSGAVSEDVWHHIAFDRSGNTVRLYVDGVMVDSDTVSGSLFASTAALIFGALNGTNAGLQTYFDEWRITKGVARYASDGGFTVPDAPYPEGLPPEEQSPERVSQHGLLVLAEMGADARLSQHGMLVLAEMEARARVSQHGLLVLADYAPCLTRRAQLWRIARRDGTVLAFTSHDRSIVYGADTYEPCYSLMASASHQAGDQEGSSNLELRGIIDDAAISAADIEAGLYDDAYVQVFLVAWRQPADDFISIDSVRRLNAGWVGTISSGEDGVKLEVLGPGQRLAQKAITNVFAPGCRFEFGDPDTCGVDIEALKLSGEVVSVQDNGEFTCTLSAGTSAAQYDQGFVTWLTGGSAGAVCETKTVEFLTGGLVQIVLWSPAPFLPAAGDTFDLYPGCDRLAATCKDVYDNKLNFGGFDTIPGNDAIAATPDAKK